MNHPSGESQSRAGPRYRAPGRVNLIGEHTDYNDGFVMPAAIDLYTEVSITPRDDRRLFIYSGNFSENVEINLDDLNPRPHGHWSDYVCGVAVTLERAGYRLRGADIEIGSSVPIGSGLSSSAALEVAAGYAILRNSDIEIDRVELARLCQRAENDFVGMHCGIMDQYISCFGRAGRALMLDCRSLEYQFLPLPENVRLVICNTMVNIAARIDGVYGARMTGGGFGGCTINLLEADLVGQFKRSVARGYEQATGLAPEIYACSTADGIA